MNARHTAAIAASLLALSIPAAARPGTSAAASATAGVIQINDAVDGVAKSASAQTLGARGTVTTSATLYGGFQLVSQTTVYIAVRGNSLGTLGVTQNYLDYPRVRIFDANGVDIITDVSARPGFNGCVSGNNINQPVVDYYANVRHQAMHIDDACAALIMNPGVYTFTVDASQAGVNSGASSVPLFGDVLFEVTLNP
jgi:hypothetical protein